MDSINVSQSSFSQDLAHVASMLRHCTSHSLLLIDEFGNGTAPIDGTALLVGVIRELLQRGPECPKTLLTTHYTEALEWFPVNQLLNYQQMQVDSNLPAHSSSNDAAEFPIVFLYRLVPGQSCESHGRLCAAMAGVDSSVRTAWPASRGPHVGSTGISLDAL